MQNLPKYFLKSITLRIIAFSICIISMQENLKAQTFIYDIDFDVVLKRTLDESDSLYHKRLAKRFTKNDPSLSDYEVLALLINFTSSKNYSPYETIGLEYNVSDLINHYQYDAAIKKCDSLLSYQPYNQEILFDKAYAYLNIGQKDSSEHYRYKFNKIMDAMAASGSGGMNDAIFSLGSKDGQNYIIQRLANRISTIGSGLDEDGNFMDIIESTNSSNDTLVMHFQIQHAINKLFETSEGFEK